MSSESIRELDEHENLVLRIVLQEAGKWRRPIQQGAICDLAWNNGRGITYNSTSSVLGSLVGRGLIFTPSPGTYLPVPLGWRASENLCRRV